MILLLPISLNLLAVIGFYLVERYTKFKKLPFITKQILFGIVFGAVSIFASSFGLLVENTKANVRDAAPLSAGLIFGAPAGIIAGLIGGIYRFFVGGDTTRIACTVATILAGLMAAGLRKLMFDDKKPTWGYGVAITVVCEVVHMLLIFLTNMANPSLAFGFVRGASIPMIIGNSLAVGTAILLISILSRERGPRGHDKEKIAQTFQRWLLVCIVGAYAVTSAFTYFLQSGIVEIETQEVVESAIDDVEADVRGKSDEHLIQIAESVREQYIREPDIPLTALAERCGVIEINVVAEDGLIVNSTDPSFIGIFNMNSTKQSIEFMVLADGEKDRYVQEYGPMGIDDVTMRKYAGVSLPDGGFVQIGYNTEQFRAALDSFVIDVTQNRHVGSGGFVAVCDENMKLITRNEWNGKHVSELGIVPPAEMENRIDATDLYKVDILDGKEYMYKFIFVEGYCIIAAMPADEATFLRDASIYNSVFMQVLIFAALFVFIYVLIKRVIINNLKKVNDTLGQITEGNLNVTVDVRGTAEFASLSDDINSTVTTLKRYIDEAATRIDKELEYAKQIQLSALPTNFPREGDYTIYAKMIAAKEVGGDFYDFYKIDSQTVAFLAADVSGKGIPAAMFMMTAKTILKDLAERGLAVNEIFTLANEKLCENNESGMFVTAWMGILDLETGKLYFANAGHNPPLLKRADGSFEYLRTRAGFVLAGMEGVKYRVNEMDLTPGDRIFLYTDGVTEATDTNEQLYGEDRLLSFMNENQTRPAMELLPALKADIDTFVGEAPQFDDITMLLLDYKLPKEGVNVKKVFPAKTEALNDVLSFIEEELEKISCPFKLVTALCVAVEEVFVNVAHYAYGEGEGDVEFTVQFDPDSGEITFRMADRGVPFDPLKKPDPDITLSADEREIGGLGIFITKKTMTSVSYAYENGENVLTMVKKIERKQ